MESRLPGTPTTPPVVVEHVGAYSAVLADAAVPVVTAVRGEDGAPTPTRVLLTLRGEAAAIEHHVDARGHSWQVSVPPEVRERLLRAAEPQDLEAGITAGETPRGTIPVTLLPPQAWPHEPAARTSVAAHVCPHALEIDELLRWMRVEHRASAIRDEMEGHRPGRRPATARAAVEVLLRVLAHELHIHYERPRIDHAGPTRVSFQEILSLDELLIGRRPDRRAGCLDLTLAMASALERLGHEPLIVFTGDPASRPDHALLGVWTGSHPAGLPVQECSQGLKEALTEDRLMVVESTVVCCDVPGEADLETAMARGRARLAGLPWHAVDVAACRPPRGLVAPWRLERDPWVCLAEWEGARFRRERQIPRLEATCVLVGLCRAAGPVTTELLAEVGSTPRAVLEALEAGVTNRGHAGPPGVTRNYTDLYAIARHRAREEGRTMVRESDLLWGLLRSQSRSVNNALERTVARRDELLTALVRRYPPPNDSEL